MIPGWLVGAWRRVGLAVDGVEIEDRTDVLWLQGEEWYADIRLARHDSVPDRESDILTGGSVGDADRGAGDATDGADLPPDHELSTPQSFAGPARWVEPVMTWQHAFNSSEEVPGDDDGTLVFEAGLMVERGELIRAGRRISYLERWERLSDETATVEHRGGATTARGVTVSTGRWRIEVDERRPASAFTATRLEAGDAGWAVVGRLVVPPVG